MWWLLLLCCFAVVVVVVVVAVVVTIMHAPGLRTDDTWLPVAVVVVALVLVRSFFLYARPD